MPRTWNSIFSFIIHSSGSPRDLHSFPTRRSSDLLLHDAGHRLLGQPDVGEHSEAGTGPAAAPTDDALRDDLPAADRVDRDRKSTRLNSSHVSISYAVFCLKNKKQANHDDPPNNLH